MASRRGLTFRIALPFALFVVAGSLLLVVWLAGRDARDSRVAFLRLAEANAAFITKSNLPPGEKLARDLSEILEIEVSFVDSAERKPGSRGIVQSNQGKESVSLSVTPSTDAQFTRDRPSTIRWILRWSTLIPLAAFWLLSLLLATVISKSIVRPIRSLARGVGSLQATDGDPAILAGVTRDDEIGQLSRALSETHGRLIEERAMREEGERAALLGQMATGLAHEIRNPVAAIRSRFRCCSPCLGTIPPNHFRKIKVPPP